MLGLWISPLTWCQLQPDAPPFIETALHTRCTHTCKSYLKLSRKTARAAAMKPVIKSKVLRQEARRTESLFQSRSPRGLFHFWMMTTERASQWEEQQKSETCKFFSVNFKVSVGAKCNGLKAQNETGAAPVYEARLSETFTFTPVFCHVAARVSDHIKLHNCPLRLYLSIIWRIGPNDLCLFGR